MRRTLAALILVPCAALRAEPIPPASLATPIAIATVSSRPLPAPARACDAGSLAGLRRAVQDGRLPSSESVSGLLDGFAWDLPDPEGDAHIGVEAEVVEAPWAAGHQLLRVSVTARHSQDGGARHLVFLVDTSPSMDAADRLPLVRRGLHHLAGILRPDDRVSLITFGRSPGVLLDGVPAADGRALHDGIARLDIGAGASRGGGLDAALALAGDDGEIVVVSDVDPGLPLGVDALARASSSGVAVHGIAVGAGPHGALGALVAAGHGRLAVADRMDALAEALEVLADPARVPVARDVQLTVAFLPERVAAWRDVESDWSVGRASPPPFDLDAGAQRTWLFEVVPLPGVGESLPLARVRVDATGAAAAHDIHGAAALFASASTDLRFASAVAGFQLRVGAAESAPSWNWIRATARDALGLDPGGARAEFLGLVGRAEQLAQR
jgi:Ca-activated chloride channel family protein